MIVGNDMTFRIYHEAGSAAKWYVGFSFSHQHFDVNHAWVGPLVEVDQHSVFCVHVGDDLT